MCSLVRLARISPKVRFHRTTLYNSIYRFDDEYADSFDRVLSASQPASPADVTP